MKIYAELPLCRQEPGRIFWPDSCWLLSNRPLYIPDFAPEFRAIPAMTAKISRLGKSVALRFADRYISQWSAALIILPARAIAAMERGEHPDPEDICFDNAVVLGDWQPFPCAESLTMRISRSTAPADGVEERNLQCAEAELKLRECVSHLSERNTLKMGDAALYPLSSDPVSLQEQMNISIFLPATDTPILATRFK